MAVKPAPPVPMLGGTFWGVWAVSQAGSVPSSPQGAAPAPRISQGDLHGGAASGRGLLWHNGRAFISCNSKSIGEASLAAGAWARSKSRLHPVVPVPAPHRCCRWVPAPLCGLGIQGLLPSIGFGPGCGSPFLCCAVSSDPVWCGKRHLAPSQHRLWGNWEGCNFAKASCPSRHPWVSFCPSGCPLCSAGGWPGVFPFSC